VFSVALDGSISFILSGKFVQLENSGDTKTETWGHNPKHLNPKQKRRAKLNSVEYTHPQSNGNRSSQSVL
jgi:hypothetical protein